jgi:hypothetical protein
MAGVSSATLEAWAIPLVAPSRFDHTYVVSSCGLRWGCRDRSTGGFILRNRIGNSAIADCLAGPNGEAGIKYLRTGVCHQISNRILHPAGITVVGCGGYAVSVALWGATGLGPWPELQTCYSGVTVSGAGSVSAGGADPQGNFSSSSGVPHVSQSDMERTLTEFLKLAEGALGHPLDQSMRRSLRRAQKHYSTRQQRLVHSLDTGVLSPEEYLDHLDALLKAMMDQMREVLGEEQFLVVFGEAGRDAGGLIDRGMFMDAIRSERATSR